MDFNSFEAISGDFVYLGNDRDSYIIGSSNEKTEDGSVVPDNMIIEVRSSWDSAN